MVVVITKLFGETHRHCNGILQACFGFLYDFSTCCFIWLQTCNLACSRKREVDPSAEKKGLSDWNDTSRVGSISVSALHVAWKIPQSRMLHFLSSMRSRFSIRTHSWNLTIVEPHPLGLTSKFNFHVSWWEYLITARTCDSGSGGVLRSWSNLGHFKVMRVSNTHKKKKRVKFRHCNPCQSSNTRVNILIACREWEERRMERKGERR